MPMIGSKKISGTMNSRIRLPHCFVNQPGQKVIICPQYGKNVRIFLQAQLVDCRAALFKRCAARILLGCGLFEPTERPMALKTWVWSARTIADKAIGIVFSIKGVLASASESGNMKGAERKFTEHACDLAVQSALRSWMHEIRVIDRRMVWCFESRGIWLFVTLVEVCGFHGETGVVAEVPPLLCRKRVVTPGVDCGIYPVAIGAVLLCFCLPDFWKASMSRKVVSLAFGCCPAIFFEWIAANVVPHFVAGNHQNEIGRHIRQTHETVVEGLQVAPKDAMPMLLAQEREAQRKA